MIALEGRQAAASARRIMQLLRSKSKFNVMCYIVLTMLASCAREMVRNVSIVCRSAHSGAQLQLPGHSRSCT